MGTIVTNIAYGTGPYVRVTELCIAFNDELEARGRARMPFIVPLVYGDRQRTVMREEFSAHDVAHPGEILLDATLGRHLGSFFYANSTYEDSLRRWVETGDSVSAAIRRHLSGVIPVESLGGDKTTVDGRTIELEINRSPRVRFDVAPSYSTSFGHITEILDGTLRVGVSTIHADVALVARGVQYAEKVESGQSFGAMAYPATFSWQENYIDRFDATLVPPITNLPPIDTTSLERGIFVTVTGIPGLERLYTEAAELGLQLYSNDVEAVSGSIRALPHVVSNPAIVLQFARSGWGSVWHSMLCGTPIVVPAYDPSDDPEIFFNNQAIEALGIGIVYHGQPLAEILAETPRVQENCRRMRDSIQNRWGTLCGNESCARLFADAFLAS